MNKIAAELVKVARELVGSTVIRDVDKFMKRQRTWFEEDDKSSREISFSTRDNGDVGEEQPGNEDIREAKRLMKELKEEFGDQIKVEPEVVDEWVSLTIRVA